MFEDTHVNLNKTHGLIELFVKSQNPIELAEVHEITQIFSMPNYHDHIGIALAL